MLFNTINYFVFLIIVVLGYYVLPKKVCYIWLLTASYYFYMQWNAKYALLMLFSTLITYLGAILINLMNASKENTKLMIRKRLCLLACISMNLIVLIYFKYFNFLIYTINAVASKIRSGLRIDFVADVILPVGISFYILQALGYLIDVYREDVPVEKNVLRYALFVSFFPQLVAGPIERSKNLMDQLKTKHVFEARNFQVGFYYILYGLFLKMVIADRVAPIVDMVFGDTKEFGGIYVLIAAILFSIQIYCDFYGYSIIARGSAKLFGINLMSNFESPYYAKNVTEFWRRWHISLSSWFRDYLYIPLGGNRKGKIRKEINRSIVFLVSGLWHGASWNYVIWGGLHAIYQIPSSVIRVIKTDGNYNKENTKGKFGINILCWIVTFTLVVFAWIFFRAESFSSAIHVVRNAFEKCAFDISVLGIKNANLIALLVAIIVLFVVDYLKYIEIDVINVFLSRNGFVRYGVFLFFFLFILIYGCYGDANEVKQFIYFQF